MLSPLDGLLIAGHLIFSLAAGARVLRKASA